jgi:predicted DCC family thiol-disulfide oxidoreductase YuxK
LIKPVDRYCYIFFDCDCNLCNGFVDFVVRHDKQDQFRLASLQSEVAREMLALLSVDSQRMDSVIVLHQGQVYERSIGALYVMRYLSMPYAWAWALRYVPSPIRDWVYDWVAAHRYRWLGKRETCRVPTAAERGKFLV